MSDAPGRTGNCLHCGAVTIGWPPDCVQCRPENHTAPVDDRPSLQDPQPVRDAMFAALWSNWINDAAGDTEPKPAHLADAVTAVATRLLEEQRQRHETEIAERVEAAVAEANARTGMALAEEYNTKLEAALSEASTHVGELEQRLAALEAALDEIRDEWAPLPKSEARMAVGEVLSTLRAALGSRDTHPEPCTPENPCSEHRPGMHTNTHTCPRWRERPPGGEAR